LWAGERRWRASRIAGLTEVPVVVRALTARQTREVALVETLMREDLNPVEEAQGYRALIEQFSMTQEQISARIGRSRSAVANALRLLALPEEVLRKLERKELSAGHARALLACRQRNRVRRGPGPSKAFRCAKRSSWSKAAAKPPGRAAQRVAHVFLEMQLACRIAWPPRAHYPGGKKKDIKH
jgi:ParB family chromosome partitioning protein